MQLRITNEEILMRQESFLKKLSDKNIEGAILFKDIDIFYLTGFRFIATERPIALIIDPNGTTFLFVPLLENDYAYENANVDNIITYPEYPGLKHPMDYLNEQLISLDFNNINFGVDSDGYSSPYGYRGPRLSEIFDNKRFTNINNVVEEMRFVKSEGEIELIKESCRWGNLAHRLLQKYSRTGLSEIEVSMKATSEATLAMVDTLGSGYTPLGKPAFAEFRGQIGPMSAFPHVTTQNLTLRKGDNLVTWGAADVWGYQSELERTMFVEEVSSEQEKYFNFMYEAQEIAFNNIKPGQLVSTVDKEVQRFIDVSGIRQFVPHHTGHSIGLMMHEAPFFDLGDDTIMKPGMVFTVEPGIFVKGIGGFRHSDTVVVTESGMEKLTYYPRDLASLIC
ncbi:M24 family metallopeptidase [Virgibacillus necropolis]|uniref:Peptidase M24 n=1 Tax=Virgibacillus necropolis TaxID=163877 RepID=A0A221MA81_9BACI|nr:Xaa-Pro peptidase family protein [Virgibacillus necropolis]ASN04547.1 peptidase M24 [Virgibacillus necropolis]